MIHLCDPRCHKSRTRSWSWQNIHCFGHDIPINLAVKAVIDFFHVTSCRHGQPWQETWGNCPQLLETADQQALLSGRRHEGGREVSASASGEPQVVSTQNTSTFSRPSTFPPRRTPCSLRAPLPARFSIIYDLLYETRYH